MTAESNIILYWNQCQDKEILMNALNGEKSIYPIKHFSKIRLYRVLLNSVIWNEAEILANYEVKQNCR